MFNLARDIKDIFSLEYHFENEDLDLEIREPSECEVLETGHHVITDWDGYIFIIRPAWVYISILKRKKDQSL